uniref:Uncharacterized protein n=1 Tax=Anguilla anguilla TaxID=7936 RepID=A0A0E9TC69_ANGAN
MTLGYVISQQESIVGKLYWPHPTRVERDQVNQCCAQDEEIGAKF